VLRCGGVLFCGGDWLGWRDETGERGEDETYLLFVCTMVGYLLRNLCVPIDDTFTQRAAYVTVLLFFVRTMMGVVIMDHLRAFTSVRCST
jgi:hypothetical protein